MRALPTSAQALLAALAVAHALVGCATIVLGPREGTNPLGVLTDVAVAQQPVEMGMGPSSGPGATAQETLYRSIDSAVSHAALSPARDKLVYVRGWGAPYSRAYVADTSDGRPWPPRVRPVERFVAQEVAERLLARPVRVTDDPTDADLWVIPWVQASGGTTTERVYRFQGYPVYYHYEDHRTTWMALLLWDRRARQVVDVSAAKNRRIVVDSYFLDLFGVRFEL